MLYQGTSNKSSDLSEMGGYPKSQ